MQFTEVVHSQVDMVGRFQGAPGCHEATGDRRASHRYCIALTMDYQVSIRRRPVVTGHGSTIDLSSRGVRFMAESQLSPGLECTLSIQWPVPLEDGIQLQLVVQGKVIRTRGIETTVRIDHYDFRTRGHDSVPGSMITPISD